MMILVSLVVFRAVATEVAASCCGAGVSGSHCREPCRTVFGGIRPGFILGFSYVVGLYLHTDFLCFSMNLL